MAGSHSAAAAEAAVADWRSQVQPHRTRMVAKIVEQLKKSCPIYSPDELSKLRRISMRFEDKIYYTATSQMDYLRRISQKLMDYEKRPQNTATINLSLTNHAENQNPVHPQSQVGNQGQPLATDFVNQSPVEPHFPKNLRSNSVSDPVRGSTCLSPVAPSAIDFSQSTTDSVGQSSNLLDISGLSQSSFVRPSGAIPNIYTNGQRQMQSRHQQKSINSQHHQQQSRNLLDQLLRQQLLKNNNTCPLLMQSHVQQRQQQKALLHSSQQFVAQTSALHSGQPSIQPAQSTNLQSPARCSLQMNQLNSIHHSAASYFHQHQQSPGKQQAQAKVSFQHSSPISLDSSLSIQQQLMNQESNTSNIQRIRSGGQQNSVPNMEQQQQKLPGNIVSTHQEQDISNQNVSLPHHQWLDIQNSISGQQHFLGSQSSILNMQPNQRPTHISGQSNVEVKQQSQQKCLAQLLSQIQQSQNQSPQQQKPLIQQQTNSLLPDIQQRLQGSVSLLQSQDVVALQKQLTQSQTGHPEISSTYLLDATSQTGHADLIDVQEEIYQKIKSMKELYFSDLSEYHRRIALKLRQQGAQMPSERLKIAKRFLEQCLTLLQASKANINPRLKENLSEYEKKIVNFLTVNRRRHIFPLQSQDQLQFRHPSGPAYSEEQQMPFQVSQLQQHYSHGNPVQQVNLQGSTTSTQTGPAFSSQCGTLLLPVDLKVETKQQNMPKPLPAPNLDPFEGTGFVPLQQESPGPLQSTGSSSRQNYINPTLQNSSNSFQPSSSPLQPSSQLQQQNLKQQQQEIQQRYLLQNKHIKHMQEQGMRQFLQQSQEQKIGQKQSSEHQLFYQQQKNQQMAQLPVKQHPQLNQTIDGNELKVRRDSTTGLYHHNYPTGQHPNYYHHELKARSSFPVSSQNVQTSSPQISQHPSPQIGQHSKLPSFPKAGTPFPSTNSPSFVCSPCTPLTQSSIPGDPGKLSGSSSLPNAVNISHQQTVDAPVQDQFLSVSTPGMSASPPLAEFISSDVPQANLSTALSSNLSVAEQPFERLVKMVHSLSPTALGSSIHDIKSVVSMIDGVAGPGNGSRFSIGEDLVATMKFHLQAQNLMSQDGSATSRKRKRHIDAMALNIVSSDGSVSDNCEQFRGLDSSELESTATSSIKRRKAEVFHALSEEIREINRQLIDVVVCSSWDENSSPAAGGVEGIIVNCSYIASALSPNLKAQVASALMPPFMSLRLLIPLDYPECSPRLLDDLPIERSKEIGDLSVKAHSQFSVSLRGLSQPMSVGDMARAWDFCAREAIREYAEERGGGCFSSTYGTWHNCVGA